MRALDRKLLRDLRHHRTQVLSIAAVVACGVMTVIAMRSTLGSVRSARDTYYAEYRFGDVFAQLKRAPASLVRRINEIPGVGAIETRVVLNVTLDVPGLPDPATGHLVSIPATQRPMLNALHLRQGRWPARQRDDEAIVSDLFARENHLAVGDSLGAVINGQWRWLHIVALGTSPEFVYEVSGSGFMTDNRRFGVLWMSEDALAPAYGMIGAFNDIVLRLAPGAQEADVIARLDALLSPYGGVGAYGREDQPSNTVVADELEQLRVIGNIFPFFFVVTAAFLLNVVLSRLIATQREEIAALKAFGYGNITVGLHYLAFAAAAVSLGSVLGIAAGIWLGSAYTGLYADIFRFPSLVHRTGWASAIGVIAVSGAAALTGAASAVWAAVRLPPAEALRPPAPARYRPLVVERLGLGHLVPSAARMVLRNMERQPLRTLASIVGVSLATAVLVSGFYPYDASARLIDVQLRMAQREDLTVAFASPRSMAAARELATVDGVSRVEPFRIVAARLRAGHRVRTGAITGVDAQGSMRRLVDADGFIHGIPPAGLVLSTSMARALDVTVGDTIIAEVIELGGAERRLAVVAELEEMLGMAAYMDRRALNAAMREGDVVSGAHLAIDRGTEASVSRALKGYPLVAGSGSRPAMLAFVEETIRENMTISTTVIVFAASVIALGIIYNGARIALSERGRELASLRVLGLTRREVGQLLLSEQAIITVLGILAGCALGFGLAAMLARAFAAERFRFPLVIDFSTYVIASCVVTVAAVGASIVVRRRIAHLDLIAVLKTRE